MLLKEGHLQISIPKTSELWHNLMDKGAIGFKRKSSQKGETIMAEEKVHTEEFQVSGEALVAKIKELVHEGNIRRILIKNEEGRTLIDIPLTLGVVGTLVAPQLAAVGAIAALLTRGTIVVEKVDNQK
jgi:hypothetical protein